MGKINNTTNRYSSIFLCALLLAPGTLKSAQKAEHSLERNCLACHEAQQIPSEMIYSRYLMRYSSKKTIKAKMFAYLRHPSVKASIMPPPFFRKFPIKQATTLDDKRLKELIEAYIAHYDVDGKIIILPKTEQ